MKATPEVIVTQWVAFYRDFFGLTVDLSGVKIPAKRAGFDYPIIVANGLTNDQVYDACAKKFPCWRYSNNLNVAVSINERDPKNGAYAIWVRDSVEPDKELSKSVDNIANMNPKIATETLLERMLHELKHFSETKSHLDINNVTLCSGSCDLDGLVPIADWRGDGFVVGYSDAVCQSLCLCAREAVTL